DVAKEEARREPRPPGASPSRHDDQSLRSAYADEAEMGADVAEFVAGLAGEGEQNQDMPQRRGMARLRGAAHQPQGERGGAGGGGDAAAGFDPARRGPARPGRL